MVSCLSISDAYPVEAQLLRTFVTVVRLGSFSAAAVELGYTQAAISQQIAALENDLKVPLLNRRPVTPTEAGGRLLEHAEPILLRLDAARADVRRMTHPPSAALAVGATSLAGGSPLLAAALSALRQRMPRLDVTVVAGAREQVLTAVARGDLDLGLTDGLAARGDPLPEFAALTAVGVSQSGVAVVLPPDHPLAGRASLRLTDLADARWIEAPGVAAPLAEIRRLAGVDGFRPAFRYDGSDTLSLIRLAAAGHGLVLLPETALPERGLPETALPGRALPETALPGRALPGRAVPGRAVPVTGITAVPVATPRVVHRVELVHGTLRDGSPAAELAALLAPRY
jgi:DNA-binding transcriptional LysR family regulator